MMSRGRSEVPDYVSQARTLAIGTREPYIAWSYLKRWATGKGPLAMKAAMIGFLEQHGSRPEAAAILPEIIKNASTMNPSERREITEFANKSFSSISGFGSQSPMFKQTPIGQRLGPSKLPLSGNRPAFSSALKPKQTPSAPASGAGERFVSQDMDHMMAMRDEVFRVNEMLRQSGQIPVQKSAASDMQKNVRPASIQQISPHHISRESFEPVLRAQKSQAIMSSLIARISSHGRSESFRPVRASVKRRKSPVSRLTRKRRVRTKARPRNKRSVRAKTATRTNPRPRTKVRMKKMAKPWKYRKSRIRRQSRRAFTKKRSR